LKRSYDLFEAAEQDLRGIIRYTREQWGSQQAARYVRDLEQAMAALAAGDPPHRDVSDLGPGLRVRRCQHHHIFCRLQEGKRPQIVAVLHERMDLITRVAARLE